MLSEDQYRLICKTCDSILLAANSPEEKMAISWLHVIREHPIFLVQYDSIFAKPTLIKIISNYFRREVINFYRTLKLGWVICKSSGRAWLGNIKKNELFDIVFVSHLLSIDDLQKNSDFYFGDLPSDLATKGVKVLIVLINHTSGDVRELERAVSQSAIPRVIISNGLVLKDEIEIWRLLKVQSKLLRKEAKSEICKIRKVILNEASAEATGSSSKTTLRIAKVIKNILFSCKASAVITTYEGHAWERLVYAAARDVNPKISCLAYMHAALFRLQHAAVRSLGRKYDPDLIFTSGTVGLNQVKNFSDEHRISSKVLGSSRFIPLISRGNPYACLVLPEGTVEECRILFGFTYLCAVERPDIIFIWRIHPILTFEQLARKIPALNNLPANIKISKVPFEKDIANGKWAIYRGSTAIVSAVVNGVIPIYLKQKDEMSIDPLFEVSDLHASVENTREFDFALECINDHSKLMSYCREFYSPWHIESLRNEISTLNLAKINDRIINNVI